MVMYVTKVHELVKIIYTKELQNLPFIYISSKFIFYIQFITSEKSFPPSYISAQLMSVYASSVEKFKAVLYFSPSEEHNTPKGKLR